jgi:outer membrane protein insertion porin family
VDVNLTVVERPTGNFMIGGAFSQAEKFTFNAAIQQANFAGSGNTIGFEINTSKYSRTIALSQTNPYFTDDGISQSFELFTRTSKPPALNFGGYTVKQNGGRLNYGVPFSEVDTVFFGAGLERTTIVTDESSPFRFKQYVTQMTGNASGVGRASTNAIPLTAAWARDSRDSAITPTYGRYQRVNLEADLFGNSKYYRAIYEQQWYRPLTRMITLALKGEVNYGHGLRGDAYPIFKNVYGGGIGSVRGYLSSSLGVVDLNGDSLGGAKRLIGSAELQMPFPGSGADKSLRWFGFVDGGQVYAEGQKMRANELRFSGGLGVSWISPVGPLKLSYAKPINAKPGDRLERFQFQMGTGF